MRETRGELGDLEEWEVMESDQLGLQPLEIRLPAAWKPG